MRVYADTNFFTALYCPGPNAAEALRLQQSADERSIPPLPVTLIGRLEMINALQQAVFCTQHGVPGICLNREYALAIESIFLEQLVNRKICRPVELSERGLERQFHDLSHRYTAKEGFRTYDILHVSSALILGCDTFWSFDSKARKLAALEGLTVN